MDAFDAKKTARRGLTEEVIQVIKRARLGPSPSEEAAFWRKRRAKDSSSSEEEDDPVEDIRRVKRRIQERVATKVARALDEISGAANMQSELLEARVAEAASARLEALESEILPELKKIEATHTEDRSLGASCQAGLERQLLDLSRKCEAVEAEREQTNRSLEEERQKRKEAQSRAFFEEREKENWFRQWQTSEKELGVVRASLAALHRLHVGGGGGGASQPFCGSFVY